MRYDTPAVKLSAANTSDDATGSNVYELFRAYEDCWVESVVIQPKGDNGATNFRVYKNNGQSSAVGGNNHLIGGCAMAATSSTGNTTYESPGTALVSTGLKRGERLLVTVGVAPTDGFDAFARIGSHYRDFHV